MLTHELDEETRNRWQAIWRVCRLRPNRRDGQALVDYLRETYDVTQAQDPALEAVVAENVRGNAPLREKLPPGQAPRPVVFYVERSGAGEALYAAQEPVFQGCRILVGVDLASGCYHVEGSGDLWDELCAFQGLDEADLENFACVGQYFDALRSLAERTGDDA